MGKSQQRKGAAGERELAAILGEYGYSCDRGGSYSMGDVPDLTGLPGVHIEVKRVEKLNVMEAMEQSIRDSERMADGVPALFHRRNRKPWLVTMRLEDWLQFYKMEQSMDKMQTENSRRSAEFQQLAEQKQYEIRTPDLNRRKTRAKGKRNAGESGWDQSKMSSL
jgi:Holliday junction resolvase